MRFRYHAFTSATQRFTINYTNDISLSLHKHWHDLLQFSYEYWLLQPDPRPPSFSALWPIVMHVQSYDSSRRSPIRLTPAGHYLAGRFIRFRETTPLSWYTWDIREIANWLGARLWCVADQAPTSWRLGGVLDTYAMWWIALGNSSPLSGYYYEPSPAAVEALRMRTLHLARGGIPSRRRVLW